MKNLVVAELWVLAKETLVHTHHIVKLSGICARNSHRGNTLKKLLLQISILAGTHIQCGASVLVFKYVGTNVLPILNNVLSFMF